MENINEEKSVENQNGKVTDLAYLRSISMGKPEIMEKIIKVYILEVSQNMKRMEDCIISKDWDTLASIAHKMKPSYKFMGISQLEGIVMNIEKHAKQRTKTQCLQDLVSKVIAISNLSVEELKVKLKKL